MCLRSSFGGSLGCYPVTGGKDKGLGYGTHRHDMKLCFVSVEQESAPE